VRGDWRYAITRRAEQDLESLDQATRRRVLEVLDRLISQPDQVDRRKLQSPDDEWRIRAGDVRVRYWPDKSARTYVILRVLPRGRAYRD